MSSSLPVHLHRSLLHELTQVTYLIHMLLLLLLFLWSFSSFFFSLSASHLLPLFNFHWFVIFDSPPVDCGRGICLKTYLSSFTSSAQFCSFWFLRHIPFSWRWRSCHGASQLAPHSTGAKIKDAPSPPLCTPARTTEERALSCRSLVTLNRWSNFIFTATLFWTLSSLGEISNFVPTPSYRLDDDVTRKISDERKGGGDLNLNHSSPDFWSTQNPWNENNLRLEDFIEIQYIRHNKFCHRVWTRQVFCYWALERWSSLEARYLWKDLRIPDEICGEKRAPEEKQELIQGGLTLSNCRHCSQISLAICTNTLCKLFKYILQYGQIHFAIWQIHFAIWTNTSIN